MDENRPHLEYNEGEMTLGLLIPMLAGWISGWVVNYLADTLPITRRFSRPVCAQCGHPYLPGSYLAFVACRTCGHRRGLRPWVVQIVMLAASLYTWLQPRPMGYGPGLVLIAYFAVVFVIDLEHRLILHPTSLVGAVLGFVIGTLVNGLGTTIVGGLAGFVIMLALYYLGVLFSRLRARRLQSRGEAVDDEEALGAGDVILAGILGLTLGWPLIWFGLLLGILLGGIIGVVMLAALIISRQYEKQALMVFVPYGPFFITSAFFILFLPNWIVSVVPK
jgi:prepilin signal peptidase PulO-like enzyme (type II secretory pathway)